MFYLSLGLAAALTALLTVLGASPWLIPAELVGFTLGFLLLIVLILFVITRFAGKPSEPGTAKPFWRFLFNETVKLINLVSRVRIELIGGEKLPEDENLLLVGNHISNYDPLIVIEKLRKRRLVFVSKPENFKIPIAGELMRKCGYMAIDRDSPRNALRTIIEAAEVLKRGETSVGIYPEGTRNHEPGGLLEFHNGVFKIAQRAGKSIAVMTIRGSENIARRAPLRSTRVRLEICEVIPAATVASLKTAELGKYIKSVMLRSLGE